MCLVVVVLLFLAVPLVCLQFVIVVFPDHTHLLYQMCVICFVVYLFLKIFLVNFLGGYVNQFMPTGAFYPFKLTDRSVIIGCNGSDIYLVPVSFKQTM